MVLTSYVLWLYAVLLNLTHLRDLYVLIVLLLILVRCEAECSGNEVAGKEAYLIAQEGGGEGVGILTAKLLKYKD